MDTTTVTMRAIVQDHYGSSDSWRLTDVARPEIVSHEVLVHVHPAGLDRGTWHAMTGGPYLMSIRGLGRLRPPQRSSAGSIPG